MIGNPHFVYGFIKDGNNQPIKNATIQIFDRDEYQGFVVGTSSETGYYQINIQPVVSNLHMINVQVTNLENSSMNQFVLNTDDLFKHIDVIIPKFNVKDSRDIEIDVQFYSYPSFFIRG